MTTATPTRPDTSGPSGYRGRGRPPIGPTIELNLPEAWRDALDAIAEERATTRAVIVREALAEALGDRLPDAYTGPEPHGLPRIEESRSRAREAALAALATDHAIELFPTR